MAYTLKQIKKFRRWFGWGFLLSILVLIPLVMWSLMLAAPSAPPNVAPGGTARNPIDLTAMLAVASLLTSCTTLIGFVLTTVGGWRKERRENANAEVEFEKKKLEVEKLRIEIERARGTGNDRSSE